MSTVTLYSMVGQTVQGHYFPSGPISFPERTITVSTSRNSGSTGPNSIHAAGELPDLCTLSKVEICGLRIDPLLFGALIGSRKLSVLRLDGCSLSQDQVDTLTANLPNRENLTTLGLEGFAGNPLSSPQICAVLDHLPPNLLHLSLGGVDNEAIQHLARVLPSSKINLLILNLELKEGERDGPKALAAAIKQTPSLERVHLYSKEEAAPLTKEELSSLFTACNEKEPFVMLEIDPALVAKDEETQRFFESETAKLTERNTAREKAREVESVKQLLSQALSVAASAKVFPDMQDKATWALAKAAELQLKLEKLEKSL